jgi:MoxR-like ATPase
MQGELSVQQVSADIIDNVERVIIGKREVVKLALVALYCGGHVLLEDVPGVGKTMLVKALAKSIGSDFKRIQFTPDLLPTDVTGVSVFNQKSGDFEFRPGPVMTNVLLADEINRSSPKTQSALLEAMEEHQVTADGETYNLPNPFFVLATQNPIEYEGTFPLPEAQLDRFMLRLRLGYPAFQEEVNLLKRLQYAHPVEGLEQVTKGQEILNIQEAVKKVHVEPALCNYIIKIVHALRGHQQVYLGASPRGSLALFKGAQALAAISGREFVLPDDIKVIAKNALPHRVILKPEAHLKGYSPEALVTDILNQVSVPVEG